MSNILDYLIHNCNAEISKCAPLNELDAGVFARFSYLPFQKVHTTKNETVKSLAQKLESVPEKDFVLQNDISLIRLMSKSPRFERLVVSDIVAINSQSSNEQFSAVAIHLPRRMLFIAYTGTDNSLHGWREDCNLAITGQMPSQLSGAKYLRKVIRKNFWKKIYVGGHSKGGNVAMYSAIVARDYYQNKIKKVYSFDGPGLSKSLLAQDSGKPVLKKIINYVPQDSIIGRLFSHEEKYKVIKSNARTLWQHDIYTWDVNLNSERFASAIISKKSDFMDKALTKWMESATDEQKEAFIESIFKILKRGNIDSPVQILSSGIRSIPTLFKSYRTLDKEEKKILTRFLKNLLKSIKMTGQGDET